MYWGQGVDVELFYKITFFFFPIIFECYYYHLLAIQYQTYAYFFDVLVNQAIIFISFVFIRPMLILIPLTLDEWEKTVLLNSGLNASFLWMQDGLERRAFLLTKTVDAGSSPNVTRFFFQWCSITKYCYIYIYNVYL